MTINKKWHKENRMPNNPSLEDRVVWHLEHQKNCSCRPIPEELLAEMKKKKVHLGITITEEEHAKWHEKHKKTSVKEHQVLMKTMGITEKEDKAWHRKYKKCKKKVKK